MIFRYICGHNEHPKMWKDKLVVMIPRPCPYCLRTNYRVITYGKTRVFIKLTITTERGNG